MGSLISRALSAPLPSAPVDQTAFGLTGPVLQPHACPLSTAGAMAATGGTSLVLGAYCSRPLTLFYQRFWQSRHHHDSFRSSAAPPSPRKGTSMQACLPLVGLLVDEHHHAMRQRMPVHAVRCEGSSEEGSAGQQGLLSSRTAKAGCLPCQEPSLS